MDGKKLNNLSKRQQIDASSKTVFMWVAGASILAAFSVVAIIFLSRQFVFNQKVYSAKLTTAKNLKADIQAADTLKQNVNLLLTNSSLSSVKTTADSSNLQVILDALPTSYDSANFGASLQGVLLNGTVASIENLSVVSPDDTSGSSLSQTSDAAGTGAQTMPFSMTITGSADQIRTSLENMEQSIRPIKITGMTIDGGTVLRAQITGETYYYPTVDLKPEDKTIKP